MSHKLADPKYADLPGIARDEPDIYETKDLPESDQTTSFYEEPADGVERIDISATDAFNRFKDKHLEAGSVDFSDRISKRQRIGYDAVGDWELAGGGANETPLQKYRRLQCEMKELLEEVGQLRQSGKEEELSAKGLVSQELVEDSLRKLVDLRLEESLGQDLVSSIADPQGTQIKKLLTQIEAFKAAAHERPESQQLTEGITFQLNYKPEQVKLAQTARVAELEKRIHRLEAVLGCNSDKLSRLSAATSKKTLLESAQHLSATASLLNSSQLDHIEGRLTALAQKMDAIAKKKEELAQDDEKDKMILELYELVKNSDNIMKVLPETVDRLKSLEGLHNKAVDFARTLTQMEAVQAEIQTSVQNNKALLQGVQESFAMNLDEIGKTVTTMDARIKAYKKK